MIGREKRLPQMMKESAGKKKWSGEKNQSQKGSALGRQK
jgi:hypothetical protein